MILQAENTFRLFWQQHKPKVFGLLKGTRYRGSTMIGAKHTHTATASRYREIEKIKVRMKHKQTKDMWHEWLNIKSSSWIQNHIFHFPIADGKESGDFRDLVH